MKRLRILIVAMLICFPAMAEEQIVPAAGRVVGANQTVFRTDLRVVNLTTTVAIVQVTFLPSNTNNESATGVPVTIASRASLQIDDVLGTLFGVDVGVGALRLSSDSLFLATSRTYTPMVGCPGTNGQFVPALDPASATARSVIAHAQLSATGASGFRTNVGAVNPGSTTVDIRLQLRSGDGVLLGSASFSVLPLSHAQVSVAALFSQQSLTTSNAFVEVNASGPVLAYLSIIDNVSGDSMFVPASPDPFAPSSNEVEMIARQWVFEPSTIEVKAGELVTVRVRAIDIDHGIAFSGVGPFTCTTDQAGQCVLEPNNIVTVTFTPKAVGSFAFFCTRFCGDSTDGTQGHLTMRGTVVVK